MGTPHRHTAQCLLCVVHVWVWVSVGGVDRTHTLTFEDIQADPS